MVHHHHHNHKHKKKSFKEQKYIASRNLPLENYLDRLDKNEHFAFVRYGDGEWNAILRDSGKAGRAQKLTKEFHKDSLKTFLENIGYLDLYFGMQNNVLRMEKTRKPIIAFLKEKNLRINWINSDVFHYASRDGKLFPLIKILRERTVVMVGPGFLPTLKERKVFSYRKLIEISRTNCYFEKDKIINQVLATQRELGDNIIYSFSAGPASEIFIPELLRKIPKNFFIDFGSLWDVFCGKRSRNYMKKEVYSEKTRQRNLGR